jgi:hypothetical protein
MGKIVSFKGRYFAGRRGKIFCTPASKNALQWNGFGLYKNSYSTLTKYIYSRHP